MSNPKKLPDPQNASNQVVLCDLGKASKKTKQFGPAERIDNPIIPTKGPYLG